MILVIFMDESGGNQKGSLKDRLRFLNILMRISRKNKMRLNFKNINAKRLANINQMFLFFYNPVKTIVNDELNVDNTILYNKLTELDDFKIDKNSLNQNVDINIIERVRNKKGVSPVDEVKKELSEKYDIKEEEISNKLVEDYIEIKDNSKKLFDLDVPEEIKEALIVDRIKAEPSLKKLDKFVELEKDIILDRDIKYDLKQDNKEIEKFNKKLEKLKKEIENIEYDIDDYTAHIVRKYNTTDFDSLLSETIGLGLGILTLPFSFARSFTLGTRLVKRSIDRIAKILKPTYREEEVIDYKVSISDIETTAKALKSSSFLLEDLFDRLDNLKYKIKINDYVLPDVDKKLKEIDVLKEGLIKKKRELNKLVESLEKSKTKAMKR